MKRFLGTAALCVAIAPMAQAETIRSNSFVGEIQRRPVMMQARDGSGQISAMQVYVSVTTVAGAVPGRDALKSAAAFAARAGCQEGQTLGTLLAGVTAKAAEYEVLCRGGN